LQNSNAQFRKIVKNPGPEDPALSRPHGAKRRAQSEKLSMSRLPIFVRYALCAMLYAI